jgi:hypothetical protein
MHNTIAISAIVVLALAAAGEHYRTVELQGQVERLQVQLADAQSRLGRLEYVRMSLREAKTEMNTLNGVVDNLKSTTLAIGFKDRAVAVLGIQSAVNEIENAAIDLESIIDEALSGARRASVGTKAEVVLQGAALPKVSTDAR